VKLLNLIVLIALFLPATSHSNDLINQLIFQDPSSFQNSKNTINLVDQRFRVGNYQYNFNQFSFNQTLDWGAFEFSQQLKSNHFSIDAFSFTHQQNQQDITLQINHKFGEIHIGNNAQALLFDYHQQYSIEFSKHTTANQVFITLGEYDIAESFLTQSYQTQFNYALNTQSGFNISCHSELGIKSCSKVKLNYHNNLHQVWLGYTDKQSTSSANNIKSEQFDVNYQVSSDFVTKEIHYRYDQTSLGINNSKGEISPYFDLYFINTAANAFGLGRKIIFAQFDYNKTNVFISKNWPLNKHSFLSRVDYSFIKLTDLKYRDYESILFLGIPILHESISIESGNLQLVRLQFKYTYDLDDYRFIVDAKQLLYWDNSSDNQTSTKRESETNEIALQVLESDKKRVHWWDGLNLTMAIQWEL